MLTFTFAGDEAGDVSFSFGKGATRYFVVAAIGTNDPDKLRSLLASLRTQAGLPAGYEFRFHSLTSFRLRQRVFTALSQADFESWAVVIDKTSLPDTFKVMPGLDFYLYFISELINLIPPEKRTGGTMILDEFGSPSLVRTELRRVLAVRGISRQFRRLVIKRSQSEPLIQIADLVAGAILRRDAKGDVRAYEIIEKKVKKVMEFG